MLMHDMECQMIKDFLCVPFSSRTYVHVPQLLSARYLVITCCLEVAVMLTRVLLCSLPSTHCLV